MLDFYQVAPNPESNIQYQKQGYFEKKQYVNLK
jgi:hypothetical protein